MPDWMDYYEELEISRNASAETIKAAYRSMCKKYHPDTYQGDSEFAAKKIKRIYSAFDILDVYKRQVHNSPFFLRIPTIALPQSAHGVGSALSGKSSPA